LLKTHERQTHLLNTGTSLVLTLNSQAVWQNGNPLTVDNVFQAGELHLTLSDGSYILRATKDCPPALWGADLGLCLSYRWY